MIPFLYKVKNKNFLNLKYKKAFSLVELVMVVLISTIFISVVVRWVFGIGSVLGSNIKSEVQTQTILALDKMEDDMRKSQNCLDRGNDSILRTFSKNPYLISFYSNPSNQSLPSLVYWRIYNGKLQRAIKTLDSTCSLNSALVDGDYQTIDANVDTTLSYFAPLDPTTGLNSTSDSLYPSNCIIRVDSNCNLKYIFVHIVLSTNTSISYDRILQLQR